jgi:hypothetical protein
VAYLTSGDLAGLDGVTSTQATNASAIIDTYLQRPEGLLWVADPVGAPCYMAAAVASATFELSAEIAPGSNVSATLTGWVTPDLVGQVLIADVAGAPEALVVGGIAGQVVTFASVLRAHASGVILSAGLVITEEKALPAKRPVTHLSRTPVIRLISGQGRYGFARRSQSGYGGYAEDISLLATLSEFGPYIWQTFDVTQASVSAITGEVWVPAGLYFANYTDVRLSYVAGYLTAPQAIKTACATIAQALAGFPELSGNVQKIQAGGTLIEKFAASGLDNDTMQMLAPYRARSFF